MNVQVEFLKQELSILSVPIDKTPLITQGLIKLCLKLYKRGSTLSDSQLLENLQQASETDSEYDEEDEDFFNVTFTPHECSIICNTDLVESLFENALEGVSEAKIDKTTYAGIKIDGEGIDSSTRRILDISRPISDAEVPIFFLSTYFSDYLLVPYDSKGHVERLLLGKGFIFSSLENSYVALQDDNPPEAGSQKPEYLTSLISVAPSEPGLILTGTRSSYDADAIELAIVKTIISVPRYFSVTMHSGETSFILDQNRLAQWPKNSLLGPLDELLTAVFVDLRQLPTNTVGVIATISQNLCDADIDISYLSTLYSSVVLISSDKVADAAHAIGADGETTATTA